MANLMSWEYSNPEKVAERREAQSCRGCQFKETATIAGKDYFLCGKGRLIERKCVKFKAVIGKRIYGGE